MVCEHEWVTRTPPGEVGGDPEQAEWFCAKCDVPKSPEDEWEEQFFPPLTPAEEASYEAYRKSLEEDEKRAAERRGKDRPKRWGEPMDGDGYFCGAEWDAGDETGYHPYDVPPCDGNGMYRPFP